MNPRPPAPPERLEYRSATPLARTASISLAAAMITIALATAWVAYAALAAVDLVPSPPTGWDTIERGEQAIWVLYLVASLFAFATLLRCQRRLIRNLGALGRDAPDLGWATACWFIPIVNVIAPCLVFRQIAKSSAAAGRDTSPLVTAWWVSWILAGLSGAAAAAVYQLTTTMDEWVVGAAVDAASNGVRLVAGALLMLLLHRLSRQQERLFHNAHAHRGPP